jgi:nitrogen-specific signal transduction histidine kinase/CheY-like chemotaxis protein
MEAQRRDLDARSNESQRLESLGMIAGGVAHDFNNLLAVVLGHAGLAARALPPDSAALEHIAHIRTAAARASELTSQMLTYSGRGETQAIPLRLGKAVRDIGELLRVTISPNARLLLELDAEDPIIEADPTQVRQVIMNLIANASDALGEERGEIRVRARSVERGSRDLREAPLDATRGPGALAVLEVADTGAGMSPETRKRIFDPFFTTKFTGRGLGLASVLGIVRAHHGAIEVTSSPGHGSTFTVYFPASDSSVPSSAKKRSAAPQAYRGDGVVLIADDEPLLLDVVAELVRTLGFEVLRAHDGEEALRLFLAHSSRLTLALLDLTMPKVTGSEVLAEIRRTGATLPVILLSGYSEADAPDPSDALTRFLAKPFDDDALVSVIRALLA